MKKKLDKDVDRLVKISQSNIKDIAFQLNNKHYQTCRGCKKCNEITKRLGEFSKELSILLKSK